MIIRVIRGRLREKIIHHPNNKIISVIIRVIRGRQRKRNLQDLRNLREIKIREIRVR